MKNLALVFAASGALTWPCIAGVNITIEEVGSDVSVTGAGTLDTSQWSYLVTINPFPQIEPGSAVTVGVPQSTADVYRLPSGFTGPASIGPGPLAFLTPIGSGDLFGLDWGSEFLIVPDNYVSNTELTGSATFLNRSLDSIGLTEGSYSWTWDTASGGTDFFTVNVVPAPGALALLVVVGGFGARRRRVI